MADKVEVEMKIEEVILELSNLPASLSKNGRRRSHWKKQMEDTRNLRDKARFLLMVNYQGYELPKFENARIHVLEKWSNNPHDYDGLASLVAPAIDAFTDLEVIPDDSPRYIRSYTMTHQKVGKRAETGVEIRVRRA